MASAHIVPLGPAPFSPAVSMLARTLLPCVSPTERPDWCGVGVVPRRLRSSSHGTTGELALMEGSVWRCRPSSYASTQPCAPWRHQRFVNSGCFGGSIRMRTGLGLVRSEFNLRHHLADLFLSSMNR